MFQIGEVVRFGRVNGEHTLGKIVKIGRTGKYKIEQMEVRGKHPIGAVWTIPPELVYKTDGTQVSSPPPKAPRSHDEIMEDFLDTYCHLSPEWLSGDGELPWQVQQQSWRRLQRHLQVLAAEFGRMVTETEAYDWHFKRREKAV